MEIDPGNEIARGAIGALCAEDGDQAAAESEFEALVKLNPRNAEAGSTSASFTISAMNSPWRKRCFRQGRWRFEPSLDRAWYGLGLVLIRQSGCDEAIVALPATSSCSRCRPYGYYQLGMTYHHLGRATRRGRVYGAEGLRAAYRGDTEAGPTKHGPAVSSKAIEEIPRTDGGHSGTAAS